MTKRHNLTVREGETFSWTYTYLDSSGSAVDLTGYTAAFTVAGWGTGTVTLGDGAGTVALSLTAAQTTDLADGGLTGFGAYADAIWGRQNGVSTVDKNLKPENFERAYTVYITSGGGTVTRILEGLVTIIRDVDV